MTNRIGYNIHGQTVPDVPHLIGHLKRIRPAWVGVMDNIGLASQIAREVGCNVWVRAWPDDTVHMRMSPEAFVAEWEIRLFSYDKSRLWIYTNNESGADSTLAAWLVDVIGIGAPRGLKFVVLNTSVGTPHPDDWYQARDLIQIAGEMPNHVIIGLHEYAGGVITSGFIGGEPGYIKPSEWPEDTSDLTLWHMGRYRFLLKYCKDNGLKVPRILITEWGFDDLGDIKQWSDRLMKTPPYENIRGWRSLKNQWQAWFGKSEQKALAQQLFYADDVIYGPEVEGYQIFCWGQSPDWLQFDVSDALEWHAALETRVAEQMPQPEPPPPPQPEPELMVVTTDRLNVRNKPALSGAVVDILKKGAIVQARESVTADGYVWRKIAQGWVAQSSADGSGALMIAAPTQPEPIPGPPPPPMPVPKPQPKYVTPDELARALAQLRADVSRALRDLANSLEVSTDESKEDAA